jgi:hypothetical protein
LRKINAAFSPHPHPQSRRENRMPVPLPKEPRSRGFAGSAPADWLGLWALSVGAAATLIAAFVYFGVGEQTGAAWVLFGAAAVIAVALYCSPQSTRRS